MNDEVKKIVAALQKCSIADSDAVIDAANLIEQLSAELEQVKRELDYDMDFKELLKVILENQEAMFLPLQEIVLPKVVNNRGLTTQVNALSVRYNYTRMLLGKNYVKQW